MRASATSEPILGKPHSAENTLSALRGNATKFIIYAGIYTSQGQVFAGYWRDRPVPMPTLPAIPDGKAEVLQFSNHQAALAKIIIFQGKAGGHGLSSLGP